MYIPRWICGNIRRDKVRNEDNLAKVEVTSYKRKCEKSN